MSSNLQTNTFLNVSDRLDQCSKTIIHKKSKTLANEQATSFHCVDVVLESAAIRIYLDNSIHARYAYLITRFGVGERVASNMRNAAYCSIRKQYLIR